MNVNRRLKNITENILTTALERDIVRATNSRR